MTRIHITNPDAKDIQFTISLGIRIVSTDDDVVVSKKYADIALYYAKASGRNRSMSPMTQASAGRESTPPATCFPLRGGWDIRAVNNDPTADRTRTNARQTIGVCLMKRFSQRRATDNRVACQPRHVAAET